jgi:hypothetical protein
VISADVIKKYALQIGGYIRAKGCGNPGRENSKYAYKKNAILIKRAVLNIMAC